jgi:DNA-binding NarL/FixJ family response regulator
MSQAVRVLVADDSAEFLSAAAALVEAVEGFELVGVADSGETAIESVALSEPDLVLVDVRMPGLGGVEAARRIAALRPQTTVVLISGALDGALLRRAQSCGAAAALDKRELRPSKLAELWETTTRTG